MAEVISVLFGPIGYIIVFGDYSMQCILKLYLTSLILFWD
jgi:hypothetical protein